MKILVVDDEDTNTLILKKMLEKSDHEVIVAGNGEQAVSQFQSNKLDLILMDIMMPVMDGYEATRIIKKKSEGRFLPIIFLTAMSADEALIDCLNNGGNDFIGKPFNKDVLHAKINAMERILKLYQINDDQKKKLQQHQAQLDSEKQVAEKIFSNLLGKSDLDAEYIHSYHKPADTFNGDIVAAVKSPRGGVNVLLGDFTGHGLVAAICTLPVMEIFNSMSIKGYGLQDILYEINRKIYHLLPKGRFLGANLIHINSSEKYLEIWNGGMPDVLLFNKSQGIRKKFMSDKVPLGILDNKKLDVSMEYCVLEEGDRIIAYSDGLLEAEDIDGLEFYGQDRLEKLISENLDSENIVENIKADLATFAEHYQYHDDVSMLEFICDERLHLNSLVLPNIDSQDGNWEFKLKLDHNSLKHVDTVPIILSTLMKFEMETINREVLFTIVSEMYSNALEHGLLELESDLKQTAEGFAKFYQQKIQVLNSLTEGYIDFKFSYTTKNDGGSLEINVEDSGNGFDYNAALGINSENQQSKGNGLRLIKSFCKELSFNESGNRIVAILEWSN